jgi:hypothetical protein
MWDQFVITVGLLGSVFLVGLFGYLKLKRHQAMKEAADKKRQQNPS